MQPGDTSLGGSRKEFPATTMGFLARLEGLSEADRRAAVETLCRRYWKPAYRFLRISWSKSNEDAKDITQAFFLWALETDAFRTYAREKGSFRGFLKVLLGRFAGHEQEALGRLKRGGGLRLLALDGDELPLQNVIIDEKTASPDQAFDQAWLDSVVGLAVARVRERFEATGRSIPFRAFEAYDLAPGEPKPTYAELAARLGLSLSDVRNHLFSVREAVREELRRELSETTSDPAALEEEWNALFGGA